MDHVAIAVKDIEASLSYYVQTLGLTVVADEVDARANLRLIYLDAGSVKIQLIQPLSEGPIQDFLNERGEGLHHVCFGVDDIPTALKSLPGGTTVRVQPGGRGRLTCFLPATLNNVRIELTEWEPFADKQGV